MLVVEDDPDVREALIFLLEQEDMFAVGATDGQDALEKIAAGFRPHLILLDLMMPVMDGVRFLQIRRDDTELNAIPVVVVSALQRMQVGDLKVEAVLRKPVDPARVIEAVRQYA